MIFDTIKKLEKKRHLTARDKVNFLYQVPDFVFGCVDNQIDWHDPEWIDEKFEYYKNLYKGYMKDEI